MRTISDALKAEQVRASRKPLVKLEVATFGHPAAVQATELQWQDFAWERLTAAADATVPTYHALAVPGDGSVCRLRNVAGALYYQRVASPSGSSDWSAWSSFGSVVAGPIAITARGANVVAFGSNGTNLYRRESSDYGATWGAWVQMANARPCERGCAAAFKANGDLAVIHATDASDPTSLYIQKRVGGTWSTGGGQIDGDHLVSALAMYHDGDWNVLALMLDGSNIRLARGIYGDGDQYAVGVWSGWQFINSSKAKIDFSGQVTMRMWRSKNKTTTYYEQISAVNQARAADNLAVDDPFVCYQSSLGAMYSFTKDNAPWFYRLRPGTEFKDMDWYKAYPLDVIATYGLALASDGTYLYAAAPNQVWRTALPGSWAPPSPGAGAGTNYAVPAADVLSIKEQVKDITPGELVFTLDNSRGTYNAPGTGSSSLIASLKRGSQVILSIGYRGSTDLLSVAGKYFIEALGYSRKPGESLFTVRCVDAWGLLERYAFNRPVEWNAGASEFTVYDLIGKVVAAVGGTLTVKSASSYMTTVYPHLSVNAGENGAVVLRHLLALVPDVIFFVGLDGYIVYPQATDSISYYLRFPK
ncbi:MAG: hypothetical protein ABSG90_07825 [Dehalococcoidia bacterium]|jgi:hypothetical protein